MDYCQECEILKDARYIALERCAALSTYAVDALLVWIADNQMDSREKKLKEVLEIFSPASEARKVLNDVRENLRQHELLFLFHRNSK
jgi:hypothetical protein